jgi:hypothetical protein
VVQKGQTAFPSPTACARQARTGDRLSPHYAERAKGTGWFRSLDLVQQQIPPELLPAYDQLPDLIVQDFPSAYVIPADTPFQLSSQAPARLVDFLLFNDVQVEKANQSFSLSGVEYPRGTYVVPMNQPKRGLANTILDSGLALSDISGLYFYAPPSVWSHPRLWGVSTAVAEDPLTVKTHPVNKADRPHGSVEDATGGAYAYLPTSIAAIQATNDLLSRGVGLLRIPTSFSDRGRDSESAEEGSDWRKIWRF